MDVTYNAQNKAYLVIAYSRAPGMSGYRGRPPVAMMKYLAVISVTFPRLFVACMSRNTPGQTQIWNEVNFSGKQHMLKVHVIGLKRTMDWQWGYPQLVREPVWASHQFLATALVRWSWVLDSMLTTRLQRFLKTTVKLRDWIMSFGWITRNDIVRSYKVIQRWITLFASGQHSMFTSKM